MNSIKNFVVFKNKRNQINIAIENQPIKSDIIYYDWNNDGLTLYTECDEVFFIKTERNPSCNTLFLTQVPENGDPIFQECFPKKNKKQI